MQTCVHAHAQFHEHTIRQRLFSLVFQLLAFPARPQKSNQLSLLEAPKCSTLLRCFVPQVWRKGISHSLSTTRGRLLFYPICPAPWGGSLSHEYLVTQATLAIKYKVLAGIWTLLVTQASHTPPPTNLTPLSGEPPADMVNIQHWYKMEIDANFVVAVHQFTLVVIATLDEYISYFNLNIFKHFHTLWLIRTSHNHLSLRDP